MKAIGFFASSLLILCATAVPSMGAFRAGISVKIVTPDPLFPVVGGVGKGEPVKEKKGDLTVRALVLEQGGTCVAIVGSDFLGFPGLLCQKVRAAVPDIPAENILIGATHCHSAPDLYGFSVEDAQEEASERYIGWVCEQTASAIREAKAQMKPVSVKIQTGMAEGKIAYNYYAPELYDHRMVVIQFLDKGTGVPLATLVNYATHPEVLGDSAGILSPDIMGPLYDRIQEKGGGIALFMNSAQGGMVTADCRGPDGKDIGTWEECLRIGNLMADEALRIAALAKIQEDPGLFCRATTIKLPVESKLMREIMEHSPLADLLKTEGAIPVQVNVINLDGAQILTIPGEALPNIGFYIKRKMYGQDNLLFGLTNDALGYILTKEDYQSFERYSYISRTSLGERTGEIFEEEALKFVDSCPRPQAP